ncbi:MAG: aldolase/citrate lyase family protein [Candidatus Nanopelagicales bacterium]
MQQTPPDVLGDDAKRHIDRLLADEDRLLANRRSRHAGRQPVHTAYVPADVFEAGTAAQWGRLALAALDEHASTAARLADATGVDHAMTASVWPRLVDKLDREPIEDLRIDLEDGYGQRSDDEEDRHVAAAAAAVGRAAAAGNLPASTGIRMKSLEASTRRRSLRSVERFVVGLLDGGGLPEGLVLTLPKVTSVAQVEAMTWACRRLEDGLGLRPGRLSLEIQVEAPQAVLGPDGTALVTRMIGAGGGRVSGLHFGTYDYTTALGIPAAQQSLAHPAADHAKLVMQLAAAGTGVRLSDGSSNVLPVGSTEQVHAAWALHARLVRHSLERGFYQGWDLHPNQLITRYLATFAFFAEGLPLAADRLRRYAERAESGTLDEPATAEALAGLLVRGVDCGALDPDEVLARTGLDRPALDAYAARRPVA